MVYEALLVQMQFIFIDLLIYLWPEAYLLEMIY